MRWIALAFPLLLAGASTPLMPRAGTADAALERARKEAQQAASQLRSLEAAAASANDEAARLRAEQLAAAAAIAEAEARIGESDAELRVAHARAGIVEQRLAAERAPISALLTGIVTMGRQPPILALADEGSVDEMVRVKALLDATMPVIRQRTSALQAQLAQRRRLALQADSVRGQLAKDREMLARRREHFAALESKAADRASLLAAKAFGAGDRVLASDEAVVAAGSEAANREAAGVIAARLAQLGFAPARPMRGDSALPPQEFGYSLPVDAPLLDGLGTVSRVGIASRGVKFATARGAPVIVPADGKIAFAAPYRGQDGIVIIDHPNGWTSLLLGISSDKPKGSRVRRGEFLGRALGPLGVELRREGVPVSPALIAASSVPLSNGSDNR